MRLSVVSKNKVPRKMPKKDCGRHVYMLYVFWEWGWGLQKKGRKLLYRYCLTFLLLPP